MRYLLAFILISVLSFSCTDDFDELNTDPKNLTIDNLDQSSLPLVTASAIYNTIHLGDRARGPFQLGHSLFADVYANYFATTAPNFDSDRYTLVGRWLNGSYRWFYENPAIQIKWVEDYARDNGLEVERAIMAVWRVYAYHRITDFWGPIPYSQFGNGQTSVPFDSQEDIYSDFFNTLDDAINVLGSNTGSTSFLGANDPIYSGDVSKWLKFANSLRLRLAMRVKYVDPSLSQSNAEKAINQGGVIEDNADNAMVTTSTNWRNPYNTITQWGEFRMSADMESVLKGYADPRASQYFDPAAEADNGDDPDGMNFPYEGMRNGQSSLDKQSTPFNSISSDMAAPFRVNGGQGPNWPLIQAAEAYFLRAEGALEGWNMGGTAQEFYELGINRSLSENGVGPTNMLGEDYVTSDKVPMGVDTETNAASTVPVAFMSGASAETQLEQIITQKWLALFPDSWEAWAERRRTGYPTLYPRLSSDNPDIPADDVPRRVPWVNSEYDTNGDAVEAAQSLLGGPDNGATRLWWDVR